MRKSLWGLCFVFLFYHNALAYWGGSSAYNIYQLASSGNFREIQNSISAGNSINSEDTNGLNAICYAIQNRNYVAYKNLVLLKADEHPSCIKRIPEQAYEEFKQGYKIRGGKISSSFTVGSVGKAGLWTLAGVGAAGAAVAVAAGGGGGGGGSSGGDSSDDPSPTPTPSPAPVCASFDLVYCVDNGICDECIGSTRSYFKLVGCVDGYILNAKKTGCIADESVKEEYPLKECDVNGVCASAKSGDTTFYKLLFCDDGYKLNEEKTKCNKVCPDYTRTDCAISAQYISETCEEDDTYHICTQRTNVTGCRTWDPYADVCTACKDKYKLDGDKCVPVCQGYTQSNCNISSQYVSDICEDDNTYHKCVSRVNTKGCMIFATDKDACSVCDDGYKLNNGICEKICEGYTRISCNNSVEYTSAICVDDNTYHKCTAREKISVGCMDYSPTSDACINCYEEYKLTNGICEQLCPGYTKQPCNNTVEYVKSYCADSNYYHICENRLNTEGCLQFAPEDDKCTGCASGYVLENGSCRQMECLGYKSTSCDITTEYISETCSTNSAFHKCRTRTNTSGCSSYTINADTCSGCKAGYSLNKGVCEFSCPGYTNVECNYSTHWQSGTCAKDSSYHKCTRRTNTTGCNAFSKTSNTCTSCMQGYTLKGGYCEFDCPTMYEDECEMATQYISEICETAPTFHICTDRENTDNCKTLSPYKDECTSCDEEYKLVDGFCTHICPSVEGKVYTKETCELETFITVSDCADSAEYHWCKTRTNFTGCTRFDPNNDLCLDCDEGYSLQDGYCISTSSLCAGYQNTDCDTQFQYMPTGSEYICKYDETYHKCLPRTNSTKGCKTLNPNYDRCSECIEDYELEDAVCVEQCPSTKYIKGLCTNNTHYTKSECPKNSNYHECVQRTNTANCTGFSVSSDECTDCKTGYMVENGFCVENCPASQGYTKNCDISQFIRGNVCPNDGEYYVCNTIRTQIKGCTSYVPDKDQCAICSSEYLLKNGTCVEKCPGYTKTTCVINYQYISSVCENDESYHTCATRSNITGCSNFAIDSDTCTDCKDGYRLNGGKCIEICPGYTKTTCTLSSHYISSTCSEDTSYHICTARTNVVGCSGFAAASDTCTSCIDGYKLNSSGKCIEICPGYTKTACIINSQYISSTCSDDADYHICSGRTNTVGCSTFVIDADQCLTCIDNYEISGNKCIEQCPSSQYTKGSCDNSYYWTKSECPKNSNYHECVQRNNTIGCTSYATNADKCLTCDENYEINGDKCVEQCSTATYTKGGCNNNEQWAKSVCPKNANYVECVARTYKTGCETFAPNEDMCLTCQDGYEISGNGCIEQCPSSIYTRGTCVEMEQWIRSVCPKNSNYVECITRTNTEHCTRFSKTTDECTACEPGYFVSLGKCVPYSELDTYTSSTSFVPITDTMTTDEGMFYGVTIINSETKINDDINIISNGDEVGGICTDNATIENNAQINIYSDTVGEMYGIRAVNSDIINNGEINLNATKGEAYGIYADNSRVENNGNIVITADNAYGIYAIHNSAVTNNGVITINGESSDSNSADGKYIYIDDSSFIVNANTIIANSSFNTNDLGGGNVLMTANSNITAPQVSGTLILSADITTNSNNDIYITPNLINGNTENLSVNSQSVMFNAYTENSGTSTDGVLIRNNFNTLIDNSSIADYLENNYTNGNAYDLFNELKTAETITELNRNIDDLFGKKMLSRMTFEDMSMLREVNLDMNNNMFKKEGGFAFGNSISPSSYDNNVGSVGRYSLNGFNLGKVSYALGVAISDVNTYDNNKDNSRSDRSFVMSAPVGYKTHGFELITSPKVGYASGEYTRNGLNGTYKGKVYKRIYALMNEARYPLDLGKLKFTPSAEFNMIGFNIKGNEDSAKPYHLRIKPQNHYSVEAGIGLNAEKEFTLYKRHKFKFNGGVTLYHEFANPYELDVSMSELDGSYRLHDEKRHDNRTVIRFGFDYELDKDVDVSASIMNNIDGECRTDAVCDIKYHF